MSLLPGTSSPIMTTVVTTVGRRQISVFSFVQTSFPSSSSSSTTTTTTTKNASNLPPSPPSQQTTQEASENLPAKTDQPSQQQQQPTYLGYLSNAFMAALPRFGMSFDKEDAGGKGPSVKGKNSAVVAAAAKRLSRREVIELTDAAVRRLLDVKTEQEQVERARELAAHITQFPASRFSALKERRLLPQLLAWSARSTTDVNGLPGEANRLLALVGHVRPPRSKGICMLSIDGGGTRGMMALEILESIERISGKNICELFDLFVGVSTGAIIASLLSSRRMKVSECKALYMDLSAKLFKQDKFAGVTGLVTAHSYYNTKKWREMLYNLSGEQTVLDSARRPDAPKLAIVSCLVNTSRLQPFVFRNYEHPAAEDAHSHFRGGTQHRMCDALQASAAAPGYFEEVQLGDTLHQDGGVLVNNPTAIGVHEARVLWPGERFHCVVSLGNGRSVTQLDAPSSTGQMGVVRTGVQDKLMRIIDSATDTELVHTSMHDLLPNDVYFRLNPYMNDVHTLDEIRPEKLAEMEADAKLYVRRNRFKIAAATKRLVEPAGVAEKAIRHLADWRQSLSWRTGSS